MAAKRRASEGARSGKGRTQRRSQEAKAGKPTTAQDAARRLAEESAFFREVSRKTGKDYLDPASPPAEGATRSEIEAGAVRREKIPGDRGILRRRTIKATRPRPAPPGKEPPARILPAKGSLEAQARGILGDRWWRVREREAVALERKEPPRALEEASMRVDRARERLASCGEHRGRGKDLPACARRHLEFTLRALCPVVRAGRALVVKALHGTGHLPFRGGEVGRAPTHLEHLVVTVRAATGAAADGLVAEHAGDAAAARRALGELERVLAQEERTPRDRGAAEEPTLVPRKVFALLQSAGVEGRNKPLTMEAMKKAISRAGPESPPLWRDLHAARQGKMFQTRAVQEALERYMRDEQKKLQAMRATAAKLKAETRRGIDPDK